MFTLHVYDISMDNNYNDVKQEVFIKTFHNENEAEDFYYANVGKHKDWKEYEIKS